MCLLYRAVVEQRSKKAVWRSRCHRAVFLNLGAVVYRIARKKGIFGVQTSRKDIAALLKLWCRRPCVVVRQTLLTAVTGYRHNMAILDGGVWPQGDCGGPDAVVCVGFRQFGSPADVLHHAVEFVDTDWSFIVPNFVIVFPVLLRILKKCIAFRV